MQMQRALSRGHALALQNEGTSTHACRLTTCVRVMDLRKLTGVSFMMGSGDMSGLKPTGSLLLFLNGETETGAAPNGWAGAEVDALKGLSALTGAALAGLANGFGLSAGVCINCMYYLCYREASVD